MNEKFEQSGLMHSCKLTKDGLLELIGIIKRCFPESDEEIHLSITTNFLGTEFESDNINEFLENQKLPLTLRNLHIYATPDRLDKSFSLSFSESFFQYISLNVKGEDKIWVLGVFNEIRNFLKTKRTWYWFLNWGFISQYIILIAFTPIIAVLTIYGAFYFYKLKEILYLISLVVFFIMWIFIARQFYKGKLLPYFKIILKPQKSFLNRENIKLIIELLSIISAMIVSIIGLLK